jgi:periplasmic protein CpxP/Spy
MKNTFAQLLMISVAAAGTLAFAQDQSTTPAPQTAPATAPSHHVATPQHELNHLTRKLALTGDQQNQILPILTDRQQQVNSIYGDTSLSKKERHAKLMAVRNDSESKLRNVLTDAQRTAYDQMKQEEHERAKAKTQGTVSN